MSSCIRRVSFLCTLEMIQYVLSPKKVIYSFEKALQHISIYFFLCFTQPQARCHQHNRNKKGNLRIFKYMDVIFIIATDQIQ